MNISPKDIKKNDFKKSLRGFDPHEVEAFLETVSSLYEKLLIENSQLQEKIRTLTTDLEIYKENESTLQKAIVKSREITEDVINNAKKKAENITKEAELNAQKVMHDIDRDILLKNRELEEIKLRNEALIEDIKLYLADKLSELEDFVKSKKIIKMELASKSTETGEPEGQENISSINSIPGYSEHGESSFEENSDVK
jgi:cell division initiation protein